MAGHEIAYSKDVLAWASSLTGGSNLRVVRLGSGRPVFKYEDEEKNSVIIKFYGEDGVEEAEEFRRMHKEFVSISMLRDSGLDRPPHRIVKAFGERADLGFGLAEEEVRGWQLSRLLIDAAKQGRDISRPVGAVGELLAKVHFARKGDSNWWVPNWKKRIKEALSPNKRVAELAGLAKQWVEYFPLPLPMVPLHGDPNPTNLIWEGDGITAIDLQMFHYGYPVEDLGEVAAELRHFFAQYAGNPWLSERYINLLYSRYSESSGLDFGVLTDFNPFYMGLWELAISSNPWLPPARRAWLVEEAERCWKYGLQRIRR